MKTCSICKEEFPIDAFYLLRTGKHQSQCKECRKAAARAYHWANRDEKNLKAKERYQKHFSRPREPLTTATREKLEREAKARYRNSDKGRAAQARERSKERHQLTDRYVKRLLIQKTALSSNEIPAELVEVKRDQLKLTRLLTGLKRAIQGEPT